MTGGLRGRAMKPVAKQFLKSDLATALTTVWAEKERSLAETVNGLQAATNNPRDLPETNPEDRAEDIRDAAAAIMAGDLQEHYLRHYTPVENPDRAVQYLGLDPEDWSRTRAKWVEKFTEAGVDADAYDIVEAHINRQFGVDRDTFEDLVVGWDDETTERAMREMLLGPLDDIEDAIQEATEALQEDTS